LGVINKRDYFGMMLQIKMNPNVATPGRILSNEIKGNENIVKEK